MLNKDGQRELAYVVLVDGIEELPGYDRVESAVIGGWRCIVPKGQFKVGDPGIYFEIDSKVPNTNPAFAFLEKRNYKIKTQKMCKSISQGLLMHAEDFGWSIGYDTNDSSGNIPYIKDNKGQTPLFVAAQMNNANLVKLLLDNGADAGIVDNEGKNAFDNCVYSVCKLHEEGMKRFEVTADKLSRELRVNALMDDVFWISNDQCDIIMDYLDKGLDPYTVVEGAPLIAHLIGDEMNKRCLERVLKKGIDLTRKIRFKGKDYTPMAFALSRSCYDCDELLSRYGADKLAAEEEETYGEIKKVKQLERNMMGRVDGN